MLMQTPAPSSHARLPTTSPASSVDTPGFSSPVARIAGMALLMLGAFVMLGWWIQSPTLVRLAADYPPMSLLTAISFVLLGAGLSVPTRDAQTDDAPLRWHTH